MGQQEMAGPRNLCPNTGSSGLQALREARGGVVFTESGRHTNTYLGRRDSSREKGVRKTKDILELWKRI